MTMTKRCVFTDEFKREAVSLLECSGRLLTQVAMELGIQPSMLGRWRCQQRTAGGSAVVVWRSERVGTTACTVSMEQAKIRRLHRELKRVQMGRYLPKMEPHPGCRATPMSAVPPWSGSKPVIIT